MPLLGGPSDKIGNRYELWWTVSQFVRIINGEAESIRIEKPELGLHPDLLPTLSDLMCEASNQSVAK